MPTAREKQNEQVDTILRLEKKIDSLEQKLDTLLAALNNVTKTPRKGSK